jgi:starch synthase (maltosyl-transferring)
VANGPRIYNLFPLLAGSVADWAGHLPRIAAMGFDWVYLNPFHYPGFSGSLYAVKLTDRLHPLFQGDSPEEPDALLGGFIRQAERLGLRVMMDLVVNHVSKDSPLIERRPGWFARNPDGAVRSPRAVDPDDPAKFTEWGDLAEIDYGNAANAPPLIEHWSALAARFARLGFAGYRCDAAYKVPAPVWSAIIRNVQAVTPDAVFAAETLGCTTEQIEALAGAGFQYLFNSAKWWDFRADWLLEQYDTLRRIAPSIAFPESHDTARLATEAPPGVDPARYARLWAGFAAFFSAGWMMPMGYEFGFRTPLNVVTTRPEDWESPAYDLSGFIAALNHLKAGTPALSDEGPQQRLTGPDDPLVALLRRTPDGAQAALLLLNLSDQPRQVDAARLAPDAGALEDVTPDGAAGPLAPYGFRLLRSRAGARVTTSARSIIIEEVAPQVDCGRYPVKREVGDVLEVSADIYKDGHDALAAAILYKDKGSSRWHETPMTAVDGNDRWAGRFRLERNGRTLYTIEAWPDAFETWRGDLAKKRAAGQAVSLELTEGVALVEAARSRADPGDAERLRRLLADYEAAEDEGDRGDLLSSALLRQIMARHPDRSRAVRYERELEVVVDRPIARFAAWYEMMARSQGSDPRRSATFDGCIRRLPEIKAMGFDVVYLLPIHPIGRKHRKGPNNTLTAGPNDPGSPYAIGSTEGGHKAVHPDLGSLDDFRRFVAACHGLGLEVALDFAIQCAPDHPWVSEHPDWFQWRPDGTIRYAENPPKKYQDIVNLDFHSRQAEALWQELLSVVLFWCDQGVTHFRVDNPHTKPVPFWEWLIGTVQERHPGTVFLSEAFTRPKMMRMLAKVGFSQSYTYFTWRNFKAEITDWFADLAQGDGRDFLRPNLFPTTPDILPPYLQTGGRPAFIIRLVLAATLSSVYGLYNSYELCEAAAAPGKEEYQNSEKYQYKVWDWERPGHIKAEITALNRIRRDNPALHEFENIRFHPADDDSVVFYSKMTLDRTNMIFVAVNLDPFDVHEATLDFPLDLIGVPTGETYEVEELLGGARHLWRGARHRVRLDPQSRPAMIFRVTVWGFVDFRTPCF